MDVIVYLIPIAILLGGAGLAAFFWSLKSGQFDDPDGAAQRILFDDDEDEAAAPRK
jgi:cbb3-type cytochrome oxidase maturation protein